MGMSENGNQEKKTTVTCPVCGAEVSNRRIYCPECGCNVKSGAPRSTAPKKQKQTDDNRTVGPKQADGSDISSAPTAAEPVVSSVFEDAASERLTDAEQAPPANKTYDDLGADFFDVKPNGEPLVFPSAEQSTAGGDANDLSNKCKKCGAEVPSGARFCGACGAVQERRCIRCGGKIAPDALFCKTCGAAQDGAAAGAAIVGTVVKPSAENVRKRSLSKVSVIWLTVGMIIGVIFMITDFLTVNIYAGDVTSLGQDGLALFVVMFGGRSTLTTLGVPIELLRFAGWLYLAVAITFVAEIVCFILNSRRNVNAAPFGMFAASILYFVIGIAVLAVTLAARACVDTSILVDNAHVTFYMGGVGIFIGSLVSFVGSLAVFLISKRVFKEKAEKKARVGYYATLGVLVAVIAAFAIVPAVADYSEKCVAPGGSGHASVKITETLDDTVYGAEVIRLDGLEEGAEYAFSIHTDEYIDAEFMEDCLALYYYDDVSGKGMVEIAFVAEPLETNQTRGASTAKLMFTYDGPHAVAIVVTFAASSRTSVGFRYTFEKVSG